MKTATNNLAPFNKPPGTGRIQHSIRCCKHEPSITATRFIISKILNHHQYNIPDNTPSIIVAKGGNNSVSYSKSFAYHNPENEGFFTHSFPRLKIGEADFENDDVMDIL